MNVFNWILDFIFTNKCISCGETLKLTEKQYFCEECKKEISPCAEKLFYVDNIEFMKAAFVYNGSIKKSVRRFKYKNEGRAGSFFATKIVKMLKEEILFNVPCVIVAVPSNIKGTDREYVQTEFLAKRIYKDLGFEYIPNAFLKKKSVKSQTKCKTIAARKQNIHNAFRLNKGVSEKIKGKNILIIEDISTTGATLSSLAETLKRYDVNKIFAACIAKTPAPDSILNYVIQNPDSQKKIVVISGNDK